MEKFDWKATIKINILKLKVVGLWPKGDKTYEFNVYTLWAAVSFTCIIFAHNFFQVVNIIFHMDDLQAVTATIYLNLSELLGMLKGYHVFQNMGLLKKLMVTLNSDLFQPKNVRQRQLIEPNLKIWRYNYILYWGMSGGAIFFWITFPILDNSVKDYRLPFMAWYPFDTRTSPNYEIAYMHQVIGILFVATSTLGVDTLIAALNMYTGAQLDILCDDLRHLGLADFNKNFMKCVRHHKEILRFCDDSNKFFNWIVFFQFFISATSIGITMFQMTVVVPLSSEFLSIMSFELAIIVEIFMYCWFGNEVQEKVNL
ncbi:odorant receptor 94b-like [Zophobas morio]|uniref:odorant receptor 94b-like n=1 Tax=Zophobas morio TaxID=2755281 RepID=UPI00308321EE